MNPPPQQSILGGKKRQEIDSGHFFKML